MQQFYFLGANSSRGFYSLYHGFPPEPDCRLHIIKAGPGTGKSTFMRKIGKAAEEAGLDVEYVLCSGDPASLDGVYIPQWKQAWVDGTAPHVTEPEFFGVNSDYVNLGAFLRKDFSAEEGKQIAQLQQDYRAEYQQAYDFLAAAEHLRRACCGNFFGSHGKEAIHRRIRGLMGRLLHGCSGPSGRKRYVFLRAISAQGDVRLNRQLAEHYRTILQLDSRLGALDEALRLASEEATARGLDVICCPSPLQPEQLEAVLIPGRSLALLGCEWEFVPTRRIHLDSHADAQKLAAQRRVLKEGEKLIKQTMELAFGKLHRAKLLHDQLEQMYKIHMDFPALDRFTREQLALLSLTKTAPRQPEAPPETEDWQG